MKEAETKDRIKEALELRGMKQAELVEKTGIDKGQMSSYLSGRYKPKQANLHLIACALSVDEAWLMGYDVPMEKNGHDNRKNLQFDEVLNDVRSMIEDAGYKLSLYNDGKESILSIKDKSGLFTLNMHDYELVNKYESLRRRGQVSAKLLLSGEAIPSEASRTYAFDCQLKALGWTYTILTEPNSELESAETYALFKNENLSFRVTGNDLNTFKRDSEAFFKERLQLLLKKSMKRMFADPAPALSKSYLEPAAAHMRTDIEVTEQMCEHDDNIMDNDEFWNK